MTIMHCRFPDKEIYDFYKVIYYKKATACLLPIKIILIEKTEVHKRIES